jgi:toxin-antitoxin system PIN domain toxin
LVDVNILLYAHNVDAPQHAASAAWIQRMLAGQDSIGLTLPVVWAFVRVSTNPRFWPSPMTAAKAFGVVKELLALPGVQLIQPGARHIEILEALVTKYKATGPLVSDAVLAALAIENGAALASADLDFSRFENLRWINPLR